MLNTLTKTKTSLKSVSFQKNLGYGGSWKAQWTNALNRDSYLFFQIHIDATDYRVPTDQLLTEANEVLETGTKLNAHYKANSILLYYWGIRLMKLGCSTKLL
jgi:hypothetical protein